MESFSASQDVAARFQEDGDDVCGKLFERSPATFLDERGEHPLGTEALMMVIEEAQVDATVKESLDLLMRSVLHTRKDCFRRSLTGGGPSLVEPLRVALKTGVD